MAAPRTNVPALRLVALALALVASGMMPVVQMPNAEAAHLGILSGPYFTAGLPTFLSGTECDEVYVMARPAGNETQVADVQITSSTPATIAEVQFEYLVRPDPGTNNAPGLSRALLWNADKASAAGWTPSVDNVNLPATGTVVFSRAPSANTSSLPIPLGTIVKTTGGVEFKTVNQVAITPPSLNATAVVQAVYPGTDGNVAANTVTLLESPIPGHNVTARNPAAMEGGTAHTAGMLRTLKFTASGTGLTSSPNGVVFTLAFRIPSTAFGTANGQTPDNFPILVRSPGGDESRFCIRMDNTPPVLNDAVTRDTDYDGRIDAIELNFTEPIDPDSFVPQEFRITLANATVPYHVLDTSPRPNVRQADACAVPSSGTYLVPGTSLATCPKRLLLLLAPGPSFDTDAKPVVIYPAPGTAGNLTDLAGNKLERVTGLAARDGAKPILVSALGLAGDNKIVLTFSEPVYGRGTAGPDGRGPLRVDDPDLCASGAITECLSDITYLDEGYPTDGPLDCVGFPGIPPPAPAVPPSNPRIDLQGRPMPNQIQSIEHALGGRQAILHLAVVDPKEVTTTTVPGPPTPPGMPWGQSEGCVDGQLGSGDTHKTFGDRIIPTLFDEVDECNRRGGPYDWAVTLNLITWPCTSFVKDAGGLRAIPYKGQRITITGPYVNEAEVNIDSFKLTLKFNGPMASARLDANGREQGIRVEDLAIDSADDSGLGPAGILRVHHTAGSDQAILDLDRRTRPTDVDDTPARVLINCAPGFGVKAFGLQNARIACRDPDDDNVEGVNMVDRTPPAPTRPDDATPELSTMDADRDGYIDGIKVYLSEPIDDSSFCMGPAAKGVGIGTDGTLEAGAPITRPPTVCTSPGHFDNGGFQNNFAPPCSQPDEFGILIVHNIPGPYTWDTDRLPNDNQGIIRFPQTPGYLQRTDFIPAISTNPCWAQEGYGIDRQPGGIIGPNELVGIGTNRGAGLFFDLAHDFVPANPPYLAANPMKRVCGREFDSPTPTGIPRCNAGNGILARVVDGAPPAIWSARTIDTPDINDLNRADPEGNGYLDGYVLTFSEPVDDCDFRVAEWEVQGRTITGMRTNRSTDARFPNCTPGSALVPEQNDQVIVITFREGPNPDTDARPELVYKGPSCNRCGMQDINGVIMPALGPLSINEEDDARPVLMCVGGFVGRAEALVTFSEPVDNGDRGPVSRTSFVYGNVDQAPSSGLTSEVDEIPVEHRANAKTAIVRLSAPLTSSDMRSDTLAAQVHSIYEVAPSVAVKKSVSGKPHPFCEGVDLVPPGNVTNLQVVSGLTTANSVMLSWLAPGSDHNVPGGNGNVTGYMVKVSTSRITDEDFDHVAGAGIVALYRSEHDASSCAGNTTVVGAVHIRLDPNPCQLAQPGEVQRVFIGPGLLANTTYHFAVRAFDNSTGPNGNNNALGIGQSVSGKTGVDLSPCAPAPVVSSPDVRQYGATLQARPTFTWGACVDEQSLVEYVVAINTDPAYRVQHGTDTVLPFGALQYRPGSALAPGNYTFHVAAVSGGGQTPTTHFPFTVGAAYIPRDRIASLNQLVNQDTQVNQTGRAFTVSWRLPSESVIDRYVPGGQLEAVQVWRYVCPEGGDCRRELAYQLNGTYAELAAGSWTDESQVDSDVLPYYRVELSFASGQVAEPTTVGFKEPEDITPRSSPLPWLIGAILVAAVLAAVVSWAVLASRARAAKQPKEEPPAGVDPETGLPTHDVKCPSCATPFQAVGALPLQITCPNCGVSGVLQ